jgi:hypothetical protein
VSLPLPLPPAVQRLGGLVAFLAAALVLGGVSGFLLARLALPPHPHPAFTGPAPAAVLVAPTRAGSNPSSSAAAMAAAMQQEEARLRRQQEVLKQQQQRLAEQQRRQLQLQRELEEEEAALAYENEKRQDNTRALAVRRKDCPCDGVPLLKILLGRFARTVGRLFRFLDKQGRNRGAVRRQGPSQQEGEGPGVSAFGEL